ncbi:hypothetical protein ZWY2020_010177 [Hordeum vulgare]|nr:hypothetical protein ZWY2020_010177 [Hordeum vulgare]
MEPLPPRHGRGRGPAAGDERGKETAPPRRAPHRGMPAAECHPDDLRDVRSAVGHLGKLALASASIASSFAIITGFSFLRGMSLALDTLCGQAFGANQDDMLGVYKQRAMLVWACSGTTVVSHVVVCWALVYRLRLGIRGAALAKAMSYLTNVSILSVYVRVSPSCKKSWTGFSL